MLLGVSVFSLGITTVCFWSPQRKQGTMAGIYGGVTNIAPGLMGLWLSKVIASMGLGVAYVIWLALLVLAIGISTPMIFNSPFHQVLFRRRQEVKKAGYTISQGELEMIKIVCHEEYEQDLFPSGSVSLTLKESAKR